MSTNHPKNEVQGSLSSRIESLDEGQPGQVSVDQYTNKQRFPSPADSGIPIVYEIQTPLAFKF